LGVDRGLLFFFDISLGERSRRNGEFLKVLPRMEHNGLLDTIAAPW